MTNNGALLIDPNVTELKVGDSVIELPTLENSQWSFIAEVPANVARKWANQFRKSYISPHKGVKSKNKWINNYGIVIYAKGVTEFASYKITVLIKMDGKYKIFQSPFIWGQVPQKTVIPKLYDFS